MAAPTGDIRARVAALLAADVDRGTLWRELEALAGEPDFDATADLWAPALYSRDPVFFEPFLLRHLHEDDEPTIRALLPQIEAAGQAALFTGLYRKVADEDTWNNEVLVLAQEAESDDALERALALRELGGDDDSLTEVVALALYRRNPARFAAYVRDHVHESWRNESTYPQLRAEARVRGDEVLYWALFRALADDDEWQASLRELLKDDVPPSAIVDELERRHIEQGWDLDGSALAPFVERFGAAIMPYIQAHQSSFDDTSLAELLPGLKATEDEAEYWRDFWVVGSSAQWNQALEELLGKPLDDTALRAALALRMPPPDQPERWKHAPKLFAKTAEALYTRSPAIARPFIETYSDEVSLRLFALAEQRRDDELLDYLTYRLLQAMTFPLYSAFPTPSQLRWQKPNQGARAKLEEYSAVLTSRFDRLVAQSPAEYVRHAANVYSHFGRDDAWPFRRSLEHNPAHIYLFTRPRDAWLRSPEAMRELLESPNTHVQLIGLAMLNEGGSDAAQRAAENITLLRAVLLNTSRRSTKRLALAALERAARADAAVVAQVLPVLEGAMHFQARRAIDERAMISFVRLRHDLAPQTATATTAAPQDAPGE